MKIVTRFPRAVREIENLFIPLKDGTRLAARIWLPEDAEADPVPAILEYLPYRKRDGTAERDALTHPYFAGHGYAGVRVDMRGSGDSDGVLLGEYLKQEQDDALEVIAWLAAQPWCSGRVGMIGISWGGFNGLQVAARRPPALKAVISLCSTDDRYADDIHFMGGCLLVDKLSWGSTMLAINATPPDPALVGERWRTLWMERLENAGLWIEEWHRRQRRDAFYKHGSVCEDYEAIECPVYTVGGWADGYTNAIFRVLEHLKVPCKGLVGPWAHKYPHFANPGPRIGFLQEALRWWDKWLKDKETGIMEEPRLRAWVQESVPPTTWYAERPGRWVAEDAWPSPRIRDHRLYLNPGWLEPEPSQPVVLSFASPQNTGLASGEWCGFGAEGEMPQDQRPDDGRSLTFDTDALEARLEILGAPAVELEVAADEVHALVAVRLTDVQRDGTSTLVTYGLFNLTHRDGHEQPQPLEPGTFYRVRVRLNDIAHAFPAGHRIRLAVSTSYWPIGWPSPRPAVLSVRTAASALYLPVRPARDEDARLRPFEPPVAGPSGLQKTLRHLPLRRSVEVDLATNETVHVLRMGEAGAALTRIEPIGMDLGYTFLKRHRIAVFDPGSAHTEVVQKTTMRRSGWSVRVECRTHLTASADSFQFGADLEAFEGEAPFASRTWRLTIPRWLV